MRSHDAFQREYAQARGAGDRAVQKMSISWALRESWILAWVARTPCPYGPRETARNLPPWKAGKYVLPQRSERHVTGCSP